MKYLFPVLIALLTPALLLAQRNCQTREYYLKNLDAYRTAPLQSKINRDTLSGEVITIPVVVHVVYHSAVQNISDAQVLSQIEALNQDFSKTNVDTLYTPVSFRSAAADCRISFCLAKVDPIGRLTSGIVRRYTAADAMYNDAMKFSASGGSDAWDAQRYLNIWVCNMGGRALGYSSLPGGPADKDGVVINYDVFGTKGVVRSPFNKGRTATHEIGHWLGLSHIWGDQLCGDDGVGDTPPQKSFNFGCPSFPKMSTCSVNNNGDMFMNFMDYADDACMNIFTNGQKNKMRACFAINGLRNSFLEPRECDSANATGGPAPQEGPLPPAPIKSFQFAVHPNPAHSYINIKSVEGTGRYFEIINVYGQPVMGFTATSNDHKVNVSGLSAGIYIVRSVSGSEKVSVRFVKL